MDAPHWYLYCWNVPSQRYYNFLFPPSHTFIKIRFHQLTKLRLPRYVLETGDSENPFQNLLFLTQHLLLMMKKITPKW